MKKVNVEPKQIIKKDSWYRKLKKESSRNEKKATERFGETRKRKEKDESDTGNKNKAEGVVQKWFLQENFEEDHEFRSEGLQEENNERKARKKQHNQLIIQNQQLQAQ